MQRVYVNQFAVDLGSDGAKTFDAVLAAAKAWIRDSAERQTGLKLDDFPDNQAFDEGVAAAHARVTRGKDASIALVDYEHADTDDSEKRWATKMRVARFRDAVDFDMTIGTGYPERRIQPMQSITRQPRLIGTLLRAHACAIGGREVVQQARTVSAEQVPDFVDAHLRSRARRLPVVVAARDDDGTEPLDTEDLARSLMGLAEVVVLDGSDAAFRLSDEVSRELGCFDGGLRVYWPGFSTRDPRFVHPLLTRARLAELRAFGRKPDNVIREHIYRVAADIGLSNQLFDLARGSLSAATQARVALANDVPGLQKEVERLRTEGDALRFELRERNEAYESLQHAFRTYQHGADAGLSDEPSLEDELERCTFAMDVVTLARRRLANVAFGEEVAKHATGYGRRNHEELWRVFAALDALAADYAAKDGALGKPVVEWFSAFELEHGRLPTPKMKESETTMNREHERTFRVRGSPRVMEKHFTVGKGDSEACIHVYWDFADDGGSIDVGYVGPHLWYSSQK